MAARIEANVAKVRETLDIWARHMAARYNGPVYLLGSILTNPTPRDYDIRIVIQDHEFAARYGNTLVQTDLAEHHPVRRRFPELLSMKLVEWDREGPSQRWIDDIAKFGAVWSQRLGANIDLQIWPDSYWREGTYPTPIRLAAPSPKWWIYNVHVPNPAAGEP